MRPLQVDAGIVERRKRHSLVHAQGAAQTQTGAQVALNSEVIELLFAAQSAMALEADQGNVWCFRTHQNGRLIHEAHSIGYEYATWQICRDR